MTDINTNFPILTTPRLSLRQLSITDAPAIFVLRSNSEINQYLDRKPAGSLEDAEVFIRSVNESNEKKDSYYWGFTERGMDKVIGIVCLFQFAKDRLSAEIGYELLPAHQGKGLMQEAVAAVVAYGFQELGLESIEAFTHPENHRSVRLLERVGFGMVGERYVVRREA